MRAYIETCAAYTNYLRGHPDEATFDLMMLDVELISKVRSDEQGRAVLRFNGGDYTTSDSYKTMKQRIDAALDSLRTRFTWNMSESFSASSR